MTNQQIVTCILKSADVGTWYLVIRDLVFG